MELIDGEIDIETNFEIENYSNFKTVYAIGSRLKDNEDEPILLLKSEKLSPEILLLTYIDDDDEEPDLEPIPEDTKERVVH